MKYYIIHLNGSRTQVSKLSYYIEFWLWIIGLSVMILTCLAIWVSLIEQLK